MAPGNGRAPSTLPVVLGPIAREAASHFGGRPVVVDPTGSLTYAELDRRADDLAAGLAAMGVAEGDVVALTLPSGGDWLVAAVALARLGAVIAGVSTAITAVERRDLVELVEPALVLAGPDTVDGLPLRCRGRGARAGRPRRRARGRRAARRRRVRD